jgi:DNA-3-methyladenine glycosylase
VSRLGVDFFARDALAVAWDLIGVHIHSGDVVLRITEVEAYRWPDDTANHCRSGRTPRNAPMWGPPGRLYIYVCYGIHQMLNIVTGQEGEGTAVLVRAAEPVQGIETVRMRRGDRRGPVLLTGPGKVGAALGVDTRWCGHSVTEAGGVELHDGPPPSRYAVGPRVGVDYASPAHVSAPWRIADATTSWVSHRRTLYDAEYPCPGSTSR